MIWPHQAADRQHQSPKTNGEPALLPGWEKLAAAAVIGDCGA